MVQGKTFNIYFSLLRNSIQFFCFVYLNPEYEIIINKILITKLFIFNAYGMYFNNQNDTQFRMTLLDTATPIKMVK